jgi:hypothetical protein
VLLPAGVLVRRADAVTVIGAGLVAKARGRGHRTIAAGLGRPVSTVRGWLRRCARVADAVAAVLGPLAVECDASFVPPEPTGSVVGDVVALCAAFAAAAVRRLGSSPPWRLVAAATSGLLLGPSGPPHRPVPINTS